MVARRLFEHENYAHLYLVCILETWILLKLGVQVSIVYAIVENENRVTGKSKISQNAKMWIVGREWDTYAVVGRTSNLVLFQLITY
jgi:hypothetical protein